MGFQLSREAADQIFALLLEQYDIWAPKRFTGAGCFSDTDVIRYDRVRALEEIVFDKRSDYSFKEALLSINETLFYFTEDTATVPAVQDKGLLIFLRSCDLHALRRLDEIYLRNGPVDFYYQRLREKAKFVLMGCQESCDTGFCVSFGTNRTEAYDLYLHVTAEVVLAECRSNALLPFFQGAQAAEVEPEYVRKNKEKVTIPKNLSLERFQDPLFASYGSRCIGCGRCNFVCPTCTCFTMQDLSYGDNPKVGERRRVWASCQVDGFSDLAGGGSFRKTQPERMRFKVMHKIYDFEKRFGYPMCVGCGRCDAVCPEYISYANLVNRLAKEEA